MTQIIKEKKTLKQALLNKRMLICILIGFSSGLPLYLLIQFVPLWLREHGVDLTTIGLFGIVLFPYTWKFLWSPIMDRYVPPFLGRRRGWMLITQISLIVLMGILAMFNPAKDIAAIAVIVGFIAFFSASQDIVIDAYRRELLPDEELGAGTGFSIQAYRYSSFIPSGIGFIVADFMGWQAAHWFVSIFMLVGIITTLFIDETSKAGDEPQSIREAVVEPFKEFFNRDGYRSAIMILLFMLLYKLGDNMATALETPFFSDMGFSALEIGTIAKISKTVSAAVGTMIGGIIMIKLGINRSLWIFGIFQMISILGYLALALVGNNAVMLAVATSLEYLGVGLGSVALIAYMSRSTNKHFTATQFALFSSLVSIPRTFVGAASGYTIEHIGYAQFFVVCFLCAIPGMLMLFKIAPWNSKKESTANQSAQQTTAE